MRLPLDGNPRITTEYMQPGTGSLGKHLGIDYGVPVGTPVYAPGDGVVTQVSTGAAGGKTVEARINGMLWRFLHLNKQLVSVGQHINEGQHVADTGATGQVTGPHLHVDVREDGTVWSASLSNYRDPRKVVQEANIAAAPGSMPKVGSWIKLDKGVTRTTFDKNGNRVGSIYARDDTYKYLVRGVHGNRIIINSVSGGGNGVELALYYLAGGRIDGWKEA